MIGSVGKPTVVTKTCAENLTKCWHKSAHCTTLLLLRCLALAGGCAAIEKLKMQAIELIDSPKPALRADAAKALGKIGGQDVIEHLIVALKDSNELVREEVSEALKNLRYESFEENQ